jgi:hypothetical protein
MPIKDPMPDPVIYPSLSPEPEPVANNQTSNINNPKPHHTFIYLIVVLISIVIVGLVIYILFGNRLTKPTVTNFDECVQSNDGQMMLIYPPRCTYNNQTFFQQLSPEEQQEFDNQLNSVTSPTQTPQANSNPDSFSINLDAAPPIPSNIPWTEETITYDQALYNYTTSENYSLAGTSYSYTYPLDPGWDELNQLSASFSKPLQAAGWSQDVEYQGNKLQALIADGPMGGVEGLVAIDNQQNIRVILWETTRLCNPNSPCQAAISIFVSNITNLQDLIN